jgi:hypothetical protein
MNRYASRPIAALAFLALAFTSIGAAAKKAPIWPPQAHPHGLTYSEWAAAWWQWAVSVPLDEDGNHPLLDETGALCASGQEGKVWFLAGSPTSGIFTRSCTVPTGTALLIPIVNYIFCPEPNEPQTEEYARSQVSFVPGGASDLSATIDGHPVSDIQGRYFEESTLFELVLPPNSIFGGPARTYEVCIDAGYYLMVHPPSPGVHSIHFEGTLVSPLDTLDLNVTYLITVSTP